MATDKILDLLDHGEPLTTPEVAAELDVSQRAAWVYLSALADDGLVERQVGTGLQMDRWSLTDSGQESQEADRDDS